MDPFEGTSFAGLMLTELTLEFTHFNLVIRLSKVQQFALRLCTILRCPAAPAVLEIPVTGSFKRRCAKLLKPPFLQHLLQRQTACHGRMTRQAHDFQVWSLSFDGCLVR